MTVTWPAFIKFGDESRLLYVSGQHEWDIDPDLHGEPYGPQDKLVDSEGREHALVWFSEGEQGAVRPVASGSRVSPQQISAWLEGHFIDPDTLDLYHHLDVNVEMDEYRKRLAASPEEQWARIAIDFLAQQQS